MVAGRVGVVVVVDEIPSAPVIDKTVAVLVDAIVGISRGSR